MQYCIQATKTVNECQTYRTKRHKMAFCSPTEITQEVCVVAEHNLKRDKSGEWMQVALEQWRKITRVEKPFILVPRYHCNSYHYAITPSGLSAPQVENQCSWVKSAWYRLSSRI